MIDFITCGQPGDWRLFGAPVKNHLTISRLLERRLKGHGIGDARRKIEQLVTVQQGREWGVHPIAAMPGNRVQFGRQPLHRGLRRESGLFGGPAYWG